MLQGGNIKTMTNQSDINRILKQLFEVMNRNEPKWLKFCLSRGHSIMDIAEALGVTRPYIYKLIKKYKLEVK